MSNEQRPDETGIGTVEETSASAASSQAGASASTSKASKPSTPLGASAAEGQGADWRAGLLRDAKGAVKASVNNLALILRHDPAWRGRLSWHEPTGTLHLDGTPIDPNAQAAMRAKVEQDWRIAPSGAVLMAAVRVVTGAKAPDPKKASPRPTYDDWQSEFLLDQYGNPKSSFGNCCAILRNADPWAGRLAFDLMCSAPTLGGEQLSEGEVGRIRETIEKRWRISPSVENVISAVRTVAEERSTHPVRNYLEGLKWDGMERIDFIVDEQLGADRTALNIAMLRKTLISAVARAFEPGCKVDTVLVFVGKQGWKKSTFWRELVGVDWFCDSHMDIHDKDGLLTLHSAWVLEWGEIESIINRRDASDNKRFLTSAVDVFRPPYARGASKHLRSGIIVGTTNENDILVDPTGSRRFLVLKLGKPVDEEWVKTWRDQIWAEAVTAYRAGEKWFLDAERETERAELALGHEAVDPWETMIRDWAGSRLVSFEMQDLLESGCSVMKSLQTPGMARRAAGFLRRMGFDNPKERLPGQRYPKRLWRRPAQAPIEVPPENDADL